MTGNPQVEYQHQNQTPTVYLPFLTAKPWWEECEFSQRLEENWQTISEEFRQLRKLARTHTRSPDRVSGSGWDSIRIWYQGFQKRLAEHLPTTVQLVQDSPHCGDSLGAVFFSVLQPGTTVTPHCGPTNARLRYHLGLEIPAGTFLEVGGERRAWREGQCLRFDDSFSHSACNPSKQPRTVLIVDLWHPELSSLEREALAAGWNSWGPEPFRGF